MSTLTEEIEHEERTMIEAVRQFYRSEIERERRRRLVNEVLMYLAFGALGAWIVWILARGL